MSDSASIFLPRPPLLPDLAGEPCRACVTIPARNEEASLARCLQALHGQVDLEGRPLPHASFEVLVLLNNCTDRTPQVAREWQEEHPSLVLHVMERTFSADEAHVGTARRWLMDTAWWRLRETKLQPVAILATDSDSVVAPDWIAQNLRALDEGADAVGGRVSLLQEDLASLPPAVRLCYARDRRYASLVARLEDALDPRPGDRHPRHLDHFGASLACTPEAYAAAGGIPAVNPLEDEAFVDCLRRANCRLRHDPDVHVFTSARLHGRAKVGMAGQLRMWHELPCEAAHLVPSAALLEHRFRTLRQLRCVFETKHVGDLILPTKWWRDTFADALRGEATTPGFLGAVYCDVLIDEGFRGEREQPIQGAIAELEGLLEGFCPELKESVQPQLEASSYDDEASLAIPVLSGSLR